MTIEQLTGSLTNLGTGGVSNASRDEAEKKNEEFAQYLMAIKGAKLSETQLQKLGETSSQDDRTRTIEKLNERKVKSDDDQYRKMRSNGYTTGETRRGLDQFDRALERKAADSQRVAAHEKAVQNSDVTSENHRVGTAARNAQMAQPNGRSEQSGQNAGMPPNVSGDTAFGMSHDVAGQNLRDANAAGAIAADAQSTNRIDATGVSTNHSSKSARANVAASAENIANAAAQQLTNRNMMSAGKTTAASLAAVMAGMTPVSKSGNVKIGGGFDAKIMSAAGHANEVKESAKNTVTQEALTAASETQQAANDPGQSQRQGISPQTSGDVAASQTLPSTSLMERVDQARLTNRVAGAFRSLANQSGTIRMKLHPEELGALTIRMQIEAGKVSAKLEAETEAAKQLLLENMDTLKKKLKEQNLEVTAFDIEVTASETGKNTPTRNQSNLSEVAAADGKITKRNESQGDIGRVDLYS